MKRELKNFYNGGLGWICKNCEAKADKSINERSRLMTEGEAESKHPEYSNKAMAKWTDESQTALICPTCNVIESV